MLQEIELGEAGLAWVRKSLESGNTLAKLLLGRRLEVGRVFTYLAPGVSPDRAAEFRRGGLFSDVPSEIDAKWPAVVTAYLASADGRFCVVEDIAGRGDPVMDSPGERYFVQGSDVYDFLPSGVWTHEEIRHFLSKARQYPSVCALTKIPVGPSLSPRQEVPIETLQLLASNTSHILVGAYDEESYVLWTEN